MSRHNDISSEIQQLQFHEQRICPSSRSRQTQYSHTASGNYLREFENYLKFHIIIKIIFFNQFSQFY